MDSLDQQLLALLRQDARASVATLAHKLGVSRGTVNNRITKMEDAGIITGYTVSLAANDRSRVIQAMVLIAIESKSEPQVVKALSQRHEIDKLYSVSGKYDLCAMVSTDSTHELDNLLDRMREVKGVQETFSTLLLATKIDRPV